MIIPKKKEAKNKDYKEVLWESAEELRSQMDAAEYKHIVLGLIFMKYISDIFLVYRIKLRDLITDPNAKDFFVGNDPDIIEETLNEKDFYTSENIFWVPKEAQWEFFRNHAKENKGNK